MPHTPSVKERNRRAIIAAAGELATERGIGSFTAVELAERAGTSRRSIFNHFPSADDAVYAYLTGRIDPLIAHLAALGPDTVDALIRSAEEIMQGDEAFTIISHIGDVLSQGRQRADTVLWASELVEQVTCQLSEMVAEAMHLDPIDVHLLSNAMISAVQTAHTIWLSADEPSWASWNNLVVRALERVRTGHHSLDQPST